ncbi:MAG: hypothetical protein DLM53_03085 [Candidatus Eremiobacter antarcticus]|nr:AI-2E family transporter [Candidatus Eremiobacteraeota bacterium]PZR63759.1 MAG: hypothetical protein DLM53_03085 [Candidatus Eremiobacter sp. RRmetagenome_bin22]
MVLAQPGAVMWRNVLRTALIIAAIAVFIWLLAHIPKTVEVFIIATLIAYGINPLIRRLSVKVPRLAAIVIIYALFLLLLFVGAVIIVPTIVEQLQNVFSHSGAYLASAQTFIDGVQTWINKKLGGHALPPQLGNIEGQAIARLSDIFQAALAGVGVLLVLVVNYLLIGITAVILSYYLLVNSNAVRNSFLSLFPERSQERARHFVREVARVFGGFIGGQIVLCAFSGVFTFGALEFVVPQYALLLGVLTGVLYAIPYLGVFGALVIGVLLGLLKSWAAAAWTAAIIFAITKIADTVLVPKVMGESVGVSPMAIIFAVFAGGELFGVWGLILAIPAAALFKVVWVVWLLPWITGKPSTLEAVTQSTPVPIDSTSLAGR